MKNYLCEFAKEYQNDKFSKVPLMETDFLLLCQFSYLKLDGIVKSIDEEEQRGYTLWEMSKLADREVLFKDSRFRSYNEPLYDAMLQSRRYEDLKFYFYEDQVDEVIEMQFSAVTVQVDPETYIIIYRGTDEYFVSWKEDFNLSFWEKVPGQVRALEYLTAVAKRVPGKIYVCGHSKGGNFAVYATMKADETIQDRIVEIYNFDGPSFRKEVLEESHFYRISHKIHKIIPKASLVGMLLGEDKIHKVVDSSAVGIMQHNLPSWVIRNGKLKQVDKILDRSRYMDERINTWINGMTLEERKIFTKTVFDLAYASDTNNLIDMTFDKQGRKRTSQIFQAIKGLDQETKDKMQEILMELLKTTMEPMIGAVELPKFGGARKKEDEPDITPE